MSAIDLLPPGLAGAVVGVALGLTGGGGSIFALPLLVHLLHVGVRDAVGISLATVGASAIFGAWLKRAAIRWDAAILFSIMGVLSAPVGGWLGKRIPDRATLIAFAVLMAMAGIRMWRPSQRGAPSAEDSKPKQGVLVIGGLVTGLLAGVFGVGGGFLVVPALVIGAGLRIHEAIASSLFAIAVISTSALVSQGFASFSAVDTSLLIGFGAGALIGMAAGTSLRSRLSEKVLRRTFAVGMWGVALTMLAR